MKKSRARSKRNRQLGLLRELASQRPQYFAHHANRLLEESNNATSQKEEVSKGHNEDSATERYRRTQERLSTLGRVLQLYEYDDAEGADGGHG